MRMVKLVIIGFLFILSFSGKSFCGEQKVLNGILLDETGSMRIRAAETSKSLNSYIMSLGESSKKKTDIFFVRFNSGKYEELSKNPINSRSFKPMENYNPSDDTPLNDSIVRICESLEKFSEGYDKIILTIVTDGEENSSKIYDESYVKNLLQKKQDGGWEIRYMAIKLDQNDKQSWAYGERIIPNFINGVSEGKILSSDSCSAVFVNLNKLDNE